MGRPLWVLILLAASAAWSDQYNLRRLFQLDEVSTYRFRVEASLTVREEQLRFDKAEYTLLGRLKTAGIREGVASLFLSFPAIESVAAEPATAPRISHLGDVIVGAKAQNAGVVSWHLSAGTKKGPLPWYGSCFVPTEWVPPMPDRLLPIGGSYSAEALFPLASFFKEPSHPPELRIPITCTFLGSVGSGDEMCFRLSRYANVTEQWASADGKERGKGSFVATGFWTLDAATGRLVECDLKWIVRLERTAGKGPSRSRVVDAMVHLRGFLAEVGSLRDRRP